MTNQTEKELRELDAGRVWVVRRFEKALTGAGRTDFESLYAARGATLTRDKSHKGREILKLELEEDGGRRVFYMKRHRPMPWTEKLLRWVTLGRLVTHARWEWENIFRLGKLGIPTMAAAVLGEDARTGRSFLMTEAVEGGEPLDRFLQGNQDASLVRESARGLGEMVGKLHGAGLTHRDLYLSHVLVERKETGRLALVLIDLQRVCRPLARVRRWRVKDVGQLTYSCPARVSRTNRMRFLHAYFGVERLGGREKRFVGSVVGKAGRIARREAGRKERVR